MENVNFSSDSENEISKRRGSRFNDFQEYDSSFRENNNENLKNKNVSASTGKYNSVIISRSES